MTARFLETPPDMVVTTMGPQRVTMVNITKIREVGVLSHEQSCVHGSGVPESAVTARFRDTPPDMVVTTICPQRVTMVNNAKYFVEGFIS